MFVGIKVWPPDAPPVVHTFGKSELLIGRKSDNDIVLAGQDVSGIHACLQIKDGRVALVDLNSLNGTFVNGHRIQTTELGPRDEVMISSFRLSLVEDDLRPGLSPSPGDPLPPPPIVRPHESPAPAVPPIVRESAPPTVPPVTPFTGAPPPIVLSPITPPGATPYLYVQDPPRVSAAAPTPALDDGLPPIIPRPGRAQPAPDIVDPPPVAPREFAAPAPSTGETGLRLAFADPTVRRIFIRGPGRIEIERDSVRLPLERPPDSLDDLHAQLADLCGRPVPRDSPCERVLPDGLVVQTSPAADGGLFAVITRPRGRGTGGLGGLLHEQILPFAAAELLSACTRARLPVLLAGLGGVSTAPLLAALLAAVDGPCGLVRGLPVSAPLPQRCIAFDAAHGSGHMAATVRLAAADLGWIGVDEPEPAALDECAWAAATGHGIVLSIRAESAAHAFHRGRVAGVAGVPQPALPYALIALLERSGESSTRNAFRMTRLLEARRDDSGQASFHEIIDRGRRGEFITTAVPMILPDLDARGVHLDPAIFSPS